MRILWTALLLLPLAIPSAAAQEPGQPAALKETQEFDAAAALKEINDWYAAELKKYEESKVRLPYGDVVRSLRRQVRERSIAAVRGVTPESVSPEKSFPLVQLYCNADMLPEKIVTARRFLATRPKADEAYITHTHLLTAYSTQQNGKELESVLREIRPPGPAEAAAHLNQVSSTYRQVLEKTLGAETAFQAISRAESLARLEELLRDEKQRGLAENAIANAGIARAELLVSLDRRDQALQALVDARNRIPAGSRWLDTLRKAAERLGITLPPRPNP